MDKVEFMEFKDSFIDVNELLNSNIAIGVYRGEEFSDKVFSKIDNTPVNILTTIDFTTPQFIDTAFFKLAVGPIMDKLKSSKYNNKYLLFKINNIDRNLLFAGIMSYFEIKTKLNNAEEIFVSKDFSIKLLIGNSKNINYIGKLNEHESLILDTIDKIKEATIGLIQEKTKLEANIIVDNVRSLRDKYFLIEHEIEQNIYQYISFCRYNI
jgi:hypothetical protein